MLILSIDTATSTCAVGLCKDGIVLAEYKINAGMTHSEGLLLQLDQIFKRTKIDKHELDLIAVSIGPGSFTGLRIGLATAKALAYSLQVPLLGINTLEGIAYNVPIDGIILSPILDAQKGNYYQAIYEWQNEKLVELQAVEIVSFEKMLENLALLGKPSVLLGEHNKIRKESLPAWCKKGATYISMPQAASIAFAAQEKYGTIKSDEVFVLEPYYIRRSEAEELWEKRQKV